ncbi:cobaltochelatase CobN subunit [Marinobacter daqiaonensis]|uniref:Cobaltochelatase CobN subunit n=1 Tax=Marinobacter daqiaonensis TaxID=650891 RepID=A0A1I6JPR7_9GAMM|nr:cobaltochelatase subunit CobN [Marinobacter daqiaonensis]SFR80510.1 cobaltochelatase CobN subunit [Marinobacter daqiaonensis]
MVARAIHYASVLIVCLSLGVTGRLSLAATVVGIVSERSAAEMAAGAERLLQAHPEHRVILRTPEQVAELGDRALEKLLGQADGVVLAAVFGDQVGRLARALERSMGDRAFPVLAVNGDRTLTRLSRLDGEAPLQGLDDQTLNELMAAPEPGADVAEYNDALKSRFPAQMSWLEGRILYQGRTPAHLDALLRWMLLRAGQELTVPELEPRPLIRYYRHGDATTDASALALEPGPVVVLLDLDSGDRPGDRDLLDATCQVLEERGTQCFAILSRWGGASLEALRDLDQTVGAATLSGIISLQDFTVGGGEGRRRVTAALAELDVPVIKGVRLASRTYGQWRLSIDGIPADKVHYKLAMPELQGISQPLVLAVAEPERIHEPTGVALTLTRPVPERVNALVERMQRWQALQTRPNRDKRVAILYYNHPPGRQNVGADNLDVPASLFGILQWLQAEGYDTGPLPESAEALNDRIQQQGVNLTDDPLSLARMADRVPHLHAGDYSNYLKTLPVVVQEEMVHGPLGYLHERLEQAHGLGEQDIALALLDRGAGDLRHLIEHLQHPNRSRALEELDRYEALWRKRLTEGGQQQALLARRQRLAQTGIPGLKGWGEAPGKSMVVDDRMVFPGLRFGNIFVGPQPPRGWEVDEELLHANTTFPPTHQYVGFYHWLKDHHKADALVYLGRHSTREFLPRRRAGLTEDDYPDLLGGNLPLIYPYIVDGVGEGIQAKRRALAVMISHLTPPLAATELYDELLGLRQLVETWESAAEPDSPTRQRAVQLLRGKIAELDIGDDLEREIAAEMGLAREEVSVDELSPDLLVHEAGHYVTDMQEHFMPLGLHVFGRDWTPEQLDIMLTSMAGKSGRSEPEWRQELERSPAEEKRSLLAALEGRFVAPGQGNDPLRAPAVLPTGRNFHALSDDLIPTRVAWSLASELTPEALNERTGEEGSDALVLWASDTVRDEGVMIAFGMKLLGVRPVWNSRGIVKGLERLPVGPETDIPFRRNVVFTTSGLFRDLYGSQLEWLDQAVLLALDASAETIRTHQPRLTSALDQALSALPPEMRRPGTEPLAVNGVAARWVEDTHALLAQGLSSADAGTQAAWRVFGAAPGAYGAGVNRLASRSGAWSDRGQLGEAYRRRMGHVYGVGRSGEASHQAFDRQLKTVNHTYLGRASHLYGLLDNDDGFDFQGGLSNAVEHLRGEPPQNRVLQYADPDNPKMNSLQRALDVELRARNLNPQWLAPLMGHGYAGARTMGNDFLDNLWGWQVTSPQVVRSGVWDDVYDVYFLDRHGLGLDDFLSEKHNVHVKTHMQAIALLAAKRGFWDADSFILDTLAREFAANIMDHGLPGSGHTRPDHPLMDWVADRLDPEQREGFNVARKGGAPDESERSGAGRKCQDRESVISPC